MSDTQNHVKHNTFFPAWHKQYMEFGNLGVLPVYFNTPPTSFQKNGLYILRHFLKILRHCLKIFMTFQNKLLLISCVLAKLCFYKKHKICGFER